MSSLSSFCVEDSDPVCVRSIQGGLAMSCPVFSSPPPCRCFVSLSSFCVEDSDPVCVRSIQGGLAVGLSCLLPALSLFLLQLFLQKIVTLFVSAQYKVRWPGLSFSSPRPYCCFVYYVVSSLSLFCVESSDPVCVFIVIVPAEDSDPVCVFIVIVPAEDGDPVCVFIAIVPAEDKCPCLCLLTTQWAVLSSPGLVAVCVIIFIVHAEDSEPVCVVSHLHIV